MYEASALGISVKRFGLHYSRSPREDMICVELGINLQKEFTMPEKPISSWIGLHFQQFVVIRCWSWAGQMNVINVGPDKAELQKQRSLVSPLNSSRFLSTCFSRPHLFYLLDKHVTMYIEWETTHPQLLRIGVFCFCVAYQRFCGTKEQRERERAPSLHSFC